MLHVRSNGKPQKPVMSARVRRGIPAILQQVSATAALANADLLAALVWLRDLADYNATPYAVDRLRKRTAETQSYKPAPTRRNKKRAPALPVSHPDMLEN